jgi:putative nucleotidyltransferase with HDIG domain
MRLISTRNCVPGMKIAKPLYNGSGAILIGRGVALTKRMIDVLVERNITMIYVQDKATDDLDIQEDIPMEIRIEATKAIQETFTEIQSMNQKYMKSVDHLNIEKLQKVFKSVIKELKSNKNTMSFLTNIFAHDNYIFAHSVNVTIYTLAMAVKLGYNDKKLNDLAIGGILHDIGKTLLPLEVLNKPGKLTNEEFDLIKKHTEYGFEMLRKQSSVPFLAAHCAYQHHEKLDGTGYPRGLKGNDIHPYAKIMAIADVFDALTSNRSYRNAMLPHDAMEIIFAGANNHFDQELIETFRSSVASYPVGITLKLDTGETGVVVDYKFAFPSRPLVRVIKDPFGKELNTPYEIDLSQNLSIMITDCDAIMG